MRDNIQALIDAALAAPKTHVVITTYSDGSAKRFETRGPGSAEIHASGERAKIGRRLISRGDSIGHAAGDYVEVVSVEVRRISD